MYICLDPGHGPGNRTPGKFDPGATSFAVRECDIAYDFALAIKHTARLRGHKVLVTRNNMPGGKDVPVGSRAPMASANSCDVMLSLHCNASANPLVQGVETFYRTTEQKALATAMQRATFAVIGGRDRGVKHESQSQHKSLAVLSFHSACLIELGFITHPGTRKRLQSRELRALFAEAIVNALEEIYT